MANILLNIPTIQDERVPQDWLRILKVFQSKGNNILINTGLWIKKIGPIEDIHDFNWLDSREYEDISKKKPETKLGFASHAIRRNILCLKNGWRYFHDNKINAIYAPSSVLDFVIMPYYLKIRGENFVWATNLANLVPFSDPGNKFVRFLAWLFFQASLFMLRKADAIFTPTREIRKYLLARGFSENKLFETSFAIENDLIVKAKPVENIRIDALFVGRINETKGIYDMLRVLKIIVDKCPEFQFAIIGEGDKNTKKKFLSVIRSQDLENNVLFLGYKTGQEKYDLIKSAKCFWFLSVSKSESFGMALLEAVCSGIPAFVYDLPQFAWLYPNGEVDISPKGDYKIVAEKVIRLFEKGDFTNEEGKKLLGKYSWDKIAEIEYGAINKLLRNE